MPGSSLSPASRVIVPLGLVLLVTLTLPGCEDGYDPTLNYTPRTDPIVLSRPSKEKPTRLDPPGQLETFIASLPVDKKDDLLDPKSIPQAKRTELTTQLNSHFGTPSRPKNGAESNEDEAKELAEGSKLYRRHCLHCHGLNGDGRGPTAPWVNPHPRDYRLGKFKFTSSAQAAGSRRATVDDLRRTIVQGIDGTSMPAFSSLEGQEVTRIALYVKHLSIRGHVELEVLKEIASDPAAEVKETVDDRLEKNLNYWNQTEKKPIEVAKPNHAAAAGTSANAQEKKELEESIRRGFNQFLTGAAKCVSCHNDFGRANDYFYDDWGTIVRPANLTAGQYRGGRRPVDLFYRIHSGVNGAGMPGFSDVLNPQQTWDVVNFIQALPYKNMLPDDVREQVYGKK